MENSGFSPCYRELCLAELPPPNKANDVVIWEGERGWAKGERGEDGEMRAPRAKANSCGGAARDSGFPTG